jgi:hypothetical protein
MINDIEFAAIQEAFKQIGDSLNFDNIRGRGPPITTKLIAKVTREQARQHPTHPEYLPLLPLPLNLENSNVTEIEQQTIQNTNKDYLELFED